MRRRSFIAGAPSFMLTLPSAAQQPARIYRVAFVNPSSRVDALKATAEKASFFLTFFEELRAKHYVLGQNLLIEWYSADGQIGNYGPLARQVVATKPDVIHTQSTRLLLAFMGETRTIPIAAFTADPVEYGIVSDLSRPGGNVTGVVSTAGLTVYDKYLELVREIVPNARKVGFLTSSTGWAGPVGTSMSLASETLGISPRQP